MLYSHWDQGFSQARLPSGQSPWQKALPGAAVEEASGLNGFNSPSMCKEVFQFEAQETSAVQATQHVQRYLAGGTSMRGSGSIALPPVSGSQVGTSYLYVMSDLLMHMQQSLPFVLANKSGFEQCALSWNAIMRDACQQHEGCETVVAIKTSALCCRTCRTAGPASVARPPLGVVKMIQGLWCLSCCQPSLRAVLIMSSHHWISCMWLC